MAKFKLSGRAKRFLDSIGGIDEAVRLVKLRETLPRHPTVGGFYTIGGARDAFEFGRFNPDRRSCGAKTALEIAALLLIEEHATFDECFPKRHSHPLKVRLWFNELLSRYGWNGPFLDGPKRTPEAKASNKTEKLNARRERLLREIADVESELAEADAS